MEGTVNHVEFDGEAGVLKTWHIADAVWGEGGCITSEQGSFIVAEGIVDDDDCEPAVDDDLKYQEWLASKSPEELLGFGGDRPKGTTRNRSYWNQLWRRAVAGSIRLRLQ